MEELSWAEKQWWKLAAYSPFLRTRERPEEEADAYAVETLHERNISVIGLLKFFKVIQEEEKRKWPRRPFENHCPSFRRNPYTAGRIEKLREIKKRETFSKSDINPARYTLKKYSLADIECFQHFR